MAAYWLYALLKSAITERGSGLVSVPEYAGGVAGTCVYAPERTTSPVMTEGEVASPKLTAPAEPTFPMMVDLVVVTAAVASGTGGGVEVDVPTLRTAKLDAEPSDGAEAAGAARATPPARLNTKASVSTSARQTRPAE